jgi:GTPase SAR1 family protein
MNSKIKICPKCGTKASLFYCPNCGKVFEYPSFVGSEEWKKQSLRDFIRSVISVAKKQKIEISKEFDASTFRNAIYRKYCEQIACLEKLCSNKITQSYFLNSGTNMFDQMKSFVKKCELGECQIAVVGTVKAGKSAFINSLIGKEIASSYPTPETASVTRFKKSEKGDYVKVSFYTSEDWQQLRDSVSSSTSGTIEGDENENFSHLYESLQAEKIRSSLLNREDIICYVQSLEEMKSLIDKYTSARYPEHFFAKEVEVGLSDFFAPSNVVIVDTPGLDDPVPYRTNITRRYLHKANVVLLCIRSNRPEISSTELKQISCIFQELRYFKDRIITIGTQIDEPDDMLNYWKKYTLPEYLKYLAGPYLYGSVEVAEKHIFPVSAFYFSYVTKAKMNPNLFLGKTEEDKKLRKKIYEIVHRYYECPDWGELIDEYGEEEAQKRYRSPKQIFEEHKEDLLNMTQVPQIREMILNGPVRNANDIILNDIKKLYVSLNNEIKKISIETASYRQQAIELSEESNTSSRIRALEENIAKNKKQNEKQAKELSRLLAELENKSRKKLNEIKNK